MVESVSTLEVVQFFSKLQKVLPISKVERIILNRSNTGLEKGKRSGLTVLRMSLNARGNNVIFVQL